MRRLIIVISSVLMLAGCNTVKGVSVLLAFADHPIVNKAEEKGATKQDLLAIQQPSRITPIRNGSSQCFDYDLQNKGKRQEMYVAFTDTGLVNSYGFNTCSNAIKAGYVNSNKLPREN